MDKITRKILTNLSTITGTKIASIDTKTPVKLTGGKKNPLQGRVEKLVLRQNVMLGSDYEKMVNKRLKEEGKTPVFESKSRAWGVKVAGTPLVTHKGKNYVDFVFLSKPKRITYLLDGVAIDKDKIEGLPVPKPAKQNNLENKVIFRTFNLDNIIALNCGKLSVVREEK